MARAQIYAAHQRADRVANEARKIDPERLLASTVLQIALIFAEIASYILPNVRRMLGGILRRCLRVSRLNRCVYREKR